MQRSPESATDPKGGAGAAGAATQDGGVPQAGGAPSPDVVMPDMDMLPAEVKQRATALVQQWLDFCASRSAALELSSDGIKVHYASAVYLVLKSDAGRGAKEQGAPLLRSVLVALDIPVFLFFKVITQMFQSAGREPWFAALFPSAGDAEKEFKQLEAHFIILVILFAKFRKVYADVCALGEGDMEAIAQEGGHLYTKDGIAQGATFHVVWKLFLYVRQDAGRFDMIPGFYLLLACLHNAITGGPEALCSAALAKLGATRETLLPKLCEGVSAVVKDASEALALLSASVDKCVQAGTLQASVFAAKSVAGSIPQLEALLLPHHASLCEVDGALLLEKPHLVSTSSALSPSPLRDNAPPAKPPALASNPSSPPHGAAGAAPKASVPPKHDPFRTPERPTQHARPTMREAPQTPMTTALNDLAWLSSYLDGEEPRPDAVLQGFFDACGPAHNPGPAIVARCAELPKKLRISQALVDVGLKLYYKCLRAIVKKEEERCQKRDFTDMLNDDAMHRALLAICFEIVVFVHLRLSKPFPAVPVALGVCEFELLVMIENFLRDFEAALSREVRKHVVQLLKKIVDCNAWKSGSPLLSHLEDEANSKHFATVIDGCVAAAHPPNPSSTPMSNASTPLHNRFIPPSSPLVVRAAARPPRVPAAAKQAPTEVPIAPAAVAAGGVPATAFTESAPVQTTPCPAEQALRRQVQKQLYAFGRRLWFRTMDVLGELFKYLRGSSGMSHASFERCTHVLGRILADPAGRSLLHDRHLHQLVMSVVFGACKIEGDAEVTFKKIIGEHRFAFDTGEQVYWVVRIGAQEDQTGNLIEFYNRKFIPTCKDMLLEDVPAHIMAAAHEADALGRPPPSSPQNRPQRVPCTPPRSPCTPKRFVRANVAVRSPMRPERAALGMTPRTSRLWTFEQNSIGDLCAQEGRTLGKRVLTGEPSPRPRKALIMGDTSKCGALGGLPPLGTLPPAMGSPSFAVAPRPAHVAAKTAAHTKAAE